MIRFLGGRLVGLVGTVLGVTAVVSLVMTVLPGDAARLVVGPEATAARYEAVRQALHLDSPWLPRFLSWLWRAVHADLGTSFRYQGTAVAELLRRGLSLTFPLAVGVALLSFAGGMLVGILAAARLGSPTDLLLSAGAQLFLAIPEFWQGIVLIILFAVRGPGLPASGFPGWGHPQSWRSLVLPVLALALPRAAYFARLTRAALADVLFSDFVRTARAKGLGEIALLLRHALRNSLIPLVAGFGLVFARLLAGAVVVEQVFSLPGLGHLAVEAAFGRDIPVLLGLAGLVTATVVAVSTAADLAYALLDPRIRSA